MQNLSILKIARSISSSDISLNIVVYKAECEPARLTSFVALRFE